MKKLKWEKPIELRNIDEMVEPIKSIVIHYTDSMSHYAVLWQTVKALTKAKFASEKEIREQWETLLSAYKD